MSRPVDVASQAPYTTKSSCLSAVLAAVVFIMTFVPRIPIPLGYAHLGDAVIFLSFLYFNRREARIAFAAIQVPVCHNFSVDSLCGSHRLLSSNTSWYSSYLLSAAGERRRARSILSARSSLFSFPPVDGHRLYPGRCCALWQHSGRSGFPAGTSHGRPAQYHRCHGGRYFSKTTAPESSGQHRMRRYDGTAEEDCTHQ